MQQKIRNNRQGGGGVTTEVIELIRVDFDNMENHDPLEETSLGLFTERDNLSAHGSIKEFIKNYQPVNC